MKLKIAKKFRRCILGNRVFLLIVLLYLIIRMFSLLQFAPHNDEVNAAQWSQFIQADWKANKYVSISGDFFGEYKDPLQYWLGALLVDSFQNPIIGIRICSLLVGSVGLIFTYLLALKIFKSSTIARLVAIMIVFSDYFFMMDSLFLAEVYVYGFGAAFLYFIYLTVERFWDGRFSWASVVLAFLFCVLVLLVKQSGVIWIVFGFSIFGLFLASNDLLKKRNLKKGVYSTGLIAAISLTGKIAYDLIIPQKYVHIRESGTLAGIHTFNFDELLQFPTEKWVDGLRFYFQDLLAIELFWFWVIPVTLFIFLVFTKKIRPDWRLLCVLTAIWVVSFLPFVFILKMRYIRHFGMGMYFCYFLLGYILFLTFCSTRALKVAGVLLLVAFVIYRFYTSYIPLVRYGQTDLAMIETLPGWPNGIGINEMIERVKNLSPGVLVYDSQWGHPGTTLVVFAKKFPQLKLLPASRANLGRIRSLYESVKAQGKDLHFVYDSRGQKDRSWRHKVFAHKILCAKKEIIHKEYRGEVFGNTSIVICTAD